MTRGHLLSYQNPPFPRQCYACLPSNYETLACGILQTKIIDNGNDLYHVSRALQVHMKEGRSLFVITIPLTHVSQSILNMGLSIRSLVSANHRLVRHSRRESENAYLYYLGPRSLRQQKAAKWPPFREPAHA